MSHYWLLLFILWPPIGWYCCYLDWTKRWDMHLSDAVIAFFCGAGLGPIALIFLIPFDGSKVLFKRRSTK